MNLKLYIGLMPIALKMQPVYISWWGSKNNQLDICFMSEQ